MPNYDEFLNLIARLDEPQSVEIVDTWIASETGCIAAAETVAKNAAVKSLDLIPDAREALRPVIMIYREKPVDYPKLVLETSFSKGRNPLLRLPQHNSQAGMDIAMTMAKRLAFN